jgi:hypothetical protein
MLAAQAAPGAGHDGHTALKVQFICLHGVCLLLDLRAFCHRCGCLRRALYAAAGSAAVAQATVRPHAQPLQTPAPIYPHLCGKGLWISMDTVTTNPKPLILNDFIFMPF